MAPAKQIPHFKAGRLHFFCPLCQYHQSTSTIERVQLRHHAQLALLTVAVTVLSFPLFGWNGLMLYLVFWAGFEFVYRLRKRQALVCQSCGFDPFLYKQDVGRARAALKQHWETRIANENLFAGKKLKNYQTALLSKEGALPPAAASTNAEEKKNPPSPRGNTP